MIWHIRFLEIKKLTAIFILSFFILIIFPAFSFAVDINELRTSNQDMFNSYHKGDKEKAFNLYKQLIQEQAKIMTGYDITLFPSSEAEYLTYQEELKKNGLNKNINQIRQYTKQSEEFHRELFEAMMNQNPDKIRVYSQNLTKLTQDFFAKGNSPNTQAPSSDNNSIYNGSISDEADLIIDTMDDFLKSWSDYVTARDKVGDLKAFSDIHTKTPDSLIITEDDGLVMSSFKVLGKGGYYLFLKARLWIVEGYGEIGDLLGKVTSKLVDQ